MQPHRLQYRKYDGRAHWGCDARLLDANTDGRWFALPAGAAISRPGTSFANPADAVVLVPRTRSWIATFYDLSTARRPLGCRLYVDITTVPVVSGLTVQAIDLDLDVIRTPDGETRILDEDEFAEHRVDYRYPEDIVTLARRSCEEVAAAVCAATPPFDDTGWRWFPLPPGHGQSQ